MSYTLSSDQVTAIKQIGKWYRDSDKQFLTLGGYAGTGKTTLIAYLRQGLADNDPKLRVGFAAFTGKAVRVLADTLKARKVRRKGDFTGTLHSLMYDTELDSRGRFAAWRRKAKLDVGFIIVDEASMVTKELWDDLVSFGLPILAVGDHGQLPPVGSAFNLMADPALRLERIWRQAADSPITQVATLARTSGYIEPGDYGAGVVKYDRSSDEIGMAMEELLEKWQPDWLVLCGYNHTRVRLNQTLRVRMGFESPDPVVGDHVICLRNNATAKLYNGMTGVLTSVQPADKDPERLWWRAGINFESGVYDGHLLREQFGAKEGLKTPPPPSPDNKRGDVFDFGYALTVHKSQGSSADTVLLFEERSRHMSDEDWRRWLYTAVTRAERQLFIIG